MEEQRNGTNNHDLLCDTGHATKIFMRMDEHIKAELNRGMVWRTLDAERIGEMLYFKHILATDHSIGSDDVSQPSAEGFEHQLISGVGLRCICEGERYDWQLESTWDTVDINHIRVAQDYQWRPLSSDGQRDFRNKTEENISIWWRMVKDWSRPDGNIMSIQILWSGNFSCCERVLQLLEDVNTSNSIQIVSEQFTLHRRMREQYIARHETNQIAAACAAVDSSLTVDISHDDGLLCAICHEMMPVGHPAKQLPCKHIFHNGCTSTWFRRQLSCPLCRYDDFSGA